jgi:hypothetical protein
VAIKARTGRRRRCDPGVVATHGRCERRSSSYSRQMWTQVEILADSWKGEALPQPHRGWRAGGKAVDARPFDARLVRNGINVNQPAVVELGSATRRIGWEISSLAAVPTAHASPTVKSWTVQYPKFKDCKMGVICSMHVAGKIHVQNFSRERPNCR